MKYKTVHGVYLLIKRCESVNFKIKSKLIMIISLNFFIHKSQL